MQTANIPQPTTTDAIATEAYYQWLQAGKPEGRDQEFWLKAEAQLRNGTSMKTASKQPASTVGSTTRKSAAKR